MRRNPVGTQDASEGHDQREAGTAPVQCGGRALGARTTDVEVVEEEGTRPGDFSAVRAAQA